MHEGEGQKNDTYMWNNEVLLQVRVRLRRQREVQPTYLDIHEIVDVDAPQFRKLKSTLLQERCDIITLLTLANQVNMIKNKSKTINSPQRSSGGHFHPSRNR
jgi:hypothetical protein